MVEMLSQIPKYIDTNNFQKLYNNFNFIRQWNDKIGDTPLMINNSKYLGNLYNKMSQTIYHSKTLLSTATYQPIISLYLNLLNVDKNCIKDNLKIKPTRTAHFESISNIPTEEYDEYRISKIHGMDFEYMDMGGHYEQYRLLFQQKESGVTFGSYVIIGKKVVKNKTQKIVDAKKFFLKTYYGYPAENGFDSDGILTTTVDWGASSINQVDDSSLLKNSKPLDLVEPFVYKVLEELNFGPKAYFIINPYIKNGFYILTEDLSDKKNSFVLARDWEFNGKITFKDIVEPVMNAVPNIKDNLFLINVREAHIASLILNLSDIKDDNIGFIKNRNKYYWLDSDSDKINSLKRQLTKDALDWKFIDFLIPKELINPNITIEQSFLKSHLLLETEGKGEMIQQICKQSLIKEPKDRAYRDKIAFDKFKVRLINYGRRNKLFEEQQNEVEEQQKEQIVAQNDASLKLKQSVIEDIRNKEKQVITEEYTAEKYNTTEVLLLKHLLQQAAQYIENFLNVQRGESEDEAMLRHPTETVTVNGVTRKRNRTNAELIGFKNGDVPVYDEHSLDGLSKEDKNMELERRRIERLQNLNIALKRLIDYRKVVVDYFVRIRNLIDNDYNSCAQ